MIKDVYNNKNCKQDSNDDRMDTFQRCFFLYPKNVFNTQNIKVMTHGIINHCILNRLFDTL